MRILKPGEPCPCCGQPIPANQPKWKLLLLSYVAEGMSLIDAIYALTEMMDFPQLDMAEEVPRAVPEPASDEGASDPEPASPAAETEGEEKRVILQRLTDYRSAHGRGSLEDVSQKNAHNKAKRLSSDTLRMLLTGDTRLSITDWRKIGRALDMLEMPEAVANG